MAYNNVNRLNRIIKIQEITIEHTNRGVSQEWVFQNVIKPRYDISRTTYYNYLAINARSELAKRNKNLTN